MRQPRPLDLCRQETILFLGLELEVEIVSFFVLSTCMLVFHLK